jgi:hypothetical protein
LEICKGTENALPVDEDDAALTASRAARGRLLEGLRHPRFKWRSLHKLATEAAVPAEIAADLLRSDPDVRFTRGKSHEIIAGLRSRVGDAN